MRGIARRFLFTVFALCVLCACAVAAAAAPAATSTVTAVRVYGGPDSTRVIFELSGPVDYQLFQLANPDRVVVDLDNGVFGQRVGAKPGKGVVKDMRVGRFEGKARVVLDLSQAAHPKSFLVNPTGQYGYRLIVDLDTPHNQPSAIVRTIDADVAHGEPRPVVVAVDAGHGGDDPGARGPNGTLEKNVTLSIAKDLARMIDATPGMHAVLTRKGDYFVPLTTRFEIAREHKADLFVSIHANSCPDFCDARGGSVWVLSPRGKESEAGRWLAKSENASDLIGGVSLDNKAPMLASVLLDLSQGASMHAAHEVGADVLAALGRIEPLYRNTVQGANFVVLRSPDVPSILVETAFISNRADERRLDSSRDRDQLAAAIFAGIKQYFQRTPPPGTWFAAQRNKRLGLVASNDGAAVAPVPAPPPAAASSDAAPAVAQRATPPPPRVADASRRPDPPPRVVAAATPRAVVAGTGRKGSRRGAFRDLHKVSPGETLSGIAREYGISMSALRSANASKIDPNGWVQAGQVLLIPNS